MPHKYYITELRYFWDKKLRSARPPKYFQSKNLRTTPFDAVGLLFSTNNHSQMATLPHQTRPFSYILFGYCGNLSARYHYIEYAVCDPVEITVTMARTGKQIASDCQMWVRGIVFIVFFFFSKMDQLSIDWNASGRTINPSIRGDTPNLRTIKDLTMYLRNALLVHYLNTFFTFS
jgi:hypothetical protein